MTSHRIKSLKYLSVFSLPATMGVALFCQGGWAYLPFIYVFVLIPLIELFMPANPRNLSEAEEIVASADPVYDWLLYLTIPIQYGMLAWYLYVIETETLASYEYTGLVLSMGILCGAFGINIGHELGHRPTGSEQTLAKTALLSSLYLHFFIEHNRGHHRRVATAEDPATARYGEPLFTFWIRSIGFSYLSAWKLEADRLKKRKLPICSPANQMIRFTMIQGALLLLIYFLVSAQAMVAFLMAALVGILLLETVNYIEHYGLARRKRANGRYERAAPHHSWNSNHVIGRLMLFELSRHSDHHYQANRKYQVLRHHDESPQMPTGYPGMIVLALIPPLWFYVMHNRLARISTTEPA